MFLRNHAMVMILTCIVPQLSYSFAWLDDSEDKNGVIVGGHWTDPIIDVYIDSDGSLPYISKTEVCTPTDTEPMSNGLEIAECAFDNSWNTLSTTAVDLNIKGFMSRTEWEQNGFKPNFIYLDDTGEQLREYGADPASILGFALSYVQAGTTNGEYIQSIIVINGSQRQMNVLQLQTTLIHEFGHMMGLDHSGIYSEDFALLPTMFPVAIDDAEQITLSPDDIVGISAIYPSDTYTKDLGAIIGQVTDVYGNPVFGAHVVAIDAETMTPVAATHTGMPLCFGSNFVVESAGEYLLPVPPGSYYLMIESYNLSGGPGFITYDEGDEGATGSGVGLGDFGNFDKGFPTEYYPNAATPDETADIITVLNGEVHPDMDFTTGFDEDLEGAVVVSIAHESQRDLSFQVTTNGTTVFEQDFADSAKGTINAYVEGAFNPTAFPEPSTTNKWQLSVTDSRLANNGKLLGFKVYYQGVAYIYPVSDSDEIKKGTFTYTIDGRTVESSTNRHTSKTFQTNCGVKTTETAPPAPNDDPIDNSDSTPPTTPSTNDYSTDTGCASCSISHRPRIPLDLILPLSFVTLFWITIHRRSRRSGG